MHPLEYLFGLEFHGHKLGLDNIRIITDALGRPQDAYASVTVAGTNGKGSVCAMASAALRAAGYRTGCYTSPHLVRIEERFAVDGAPVTAAELEEVVERLRGLVERLLGEGRLQATPTFFEVATAAPRALDVRSARRASLRHGPRLLRRGDVTLDRKETVRRHGDGVDAAVDEEFREFRVIARRLPAETHFGTRCVRAFDDAPDHPPYGVVLLIEEASKLFGVAVHPERQLCQVVAPDREPIKPPGETVRQDHV